MTLLESQPQTDWGGRETQDSLALCDALREELGLAALSDQPTRDYGQSGSRPADGSREEQPFAGPEFETNGQQLEVDTSVAQEKQDATRSVAQVCLPCVDEYGSIDRDVLTSPQKQTSSVDITVANHPPAQPWIEVPRSLEPSLNDDPHLESRDRSRPTPQHDARLLKRNGEPAATPAVGKMDASQQTPTQINEDRDYAEVCDSLPSSCAPDHAKHIQDGNDERTLLDDETGAVNFANLSQFGRPSSQVSEDGGFDNSRGDWRQPDHTSQQVSSHAHTPFKPYSTVPETPTLSKNPFGAKPSISAPLAPSQLFGQTQFSSALKPTGVSPTSSRPSPHIAHNSISPNVAEASPLKGRTNVSSPTDIRTSSPQRLEDVPATVTRPTHLERIDEETPLHNRSMRREEATPESPTGAPVRSSGHQPLAHYENMKKSQERKLTGESMYHFVASDSDDDDDAIRRLERRRRVERKKAQAAQEMEKVSFTPLPRRDSGDRPSSSKRRRISSDAEMKSAPDGVPKNWNISKSPSDQLLIADSQRRGVASCLPGADESTQGTEDPAPGAEAMDVDNDDDVEGNFDEQHEAEDRIPATSPALSSPPDEEKVPLAEEQDPEDEEQDPGDEEQDLRDKDQDPQAQSEPDLPCLEEETLDAAHADDPKASSSLPPTRRRGRRTYGRGTRTLRRNTVVSSSASELLPKQPAISTDHHSSPLSSPAPTAVVEEDSHQEILLQEARTAEPPPDIGGTRETPQYKSPPNLSASATRRSRAKERNPITPQAPEAEQQPLEQSSDVSPLSSAPSSSAMTTPLIRESPESERAESLNLPSPAGGRNLRKRALQTGSKLSVSPQPTMRPARAAKQRAPRYGSQSTDELQLSPSTSVLEKSMVHPKSIGTVSRGGRLFEGMAFAISFQSNKSNAQSRAKLEAKIVQAGGVILSEGFEELFEKSSVLETTTSIFDHDEPMTLNRVHGETGFTALIADGHSRKAKYMQALALGLPCLAHRWITACLSKGEIVDWGPYLLCSGASAVLDNAIRSRNLAPYSAADARLAEVVDSRQKLLEGQRILVVVDSRKGRSEAKKPYIFLAQALGPSISRVFTTEQAREAISTRAKEGQPFDWVYVDKGTGTVEAVLHVPEARGKKRKRKSAASASLSPIGHVRVLNDELVIQSLILGRMVEDEEINF
ncbi:radiation sensitive protein rad9 [Amphichorda felina]